MARINQRLNGLNPLAYVGVDAPQPTDFITLARDPTVNDSLNFYLGTWWLNISTNDLFYLASLAGGVATWILVGAGASLLSLTGNTGGPVFADGARNINVIGDAVTINIVGNPGTSTLTVSTVGTGVVNSLTGNSGGAVFPTAGNINVLGTGVITVVGNPGTSTLTITPSGSIASSFPTDAGTAIPAVGVLNVFGGTGISTTGAGNTITITNTAPNNAFQTIAIQVFTVSGTYTPTAGMKYCIIEVIGGGGGAGGAKPTAAGEVSASGAGAGGGYSRGVYSAATIGASKAVVIGAGGVGGT